MTLRIGPVAFPSRLLLAPMEGVTDRAFRRVVLALSHAGGASTEFLRISSAPLSRRVARRELGPPHPTIPTALQIMAAEPEHVAASVAAAETAGAAYVDLNFGCPVKCVFGKGAGSAMLETPDRLGAIVAEAVAAAQRPVTVKLRAGVTDDARLEENLDASVEAGAAMVTLHARLRTDSYASPANWGWIARAKSYLGDRCPLVGNGGVATAADATRMMAETGCDAVMIGRGALANPFVFGGPAPTPADAARFALDYLDAMDGPERYRLGRMKQLVRWYTAGDLFDDATRAALLRVPTLAPIRDYFVAAAGSAVKSG